MTINRNKKYQKILGFGGAFTDAATLNIMALGSVMSNRIIKDYYSSEGLAYTVARVPIAGSDFSVRPYTYDDSNEDDLDLKKFQLAKEDLENKVSFTRKGLMTNMMIL